MKKLIKIFGSSILCACLLLSLSSCSRPSDNPTPDPTPEPEPPIEYIDTVMAKNGKSDYTIVLPASSNEVIDYAAEELNVYFYESTGASMNVCYENDSTFAAGDKIISLGNTKVSSEITVTKEEVNLDGYKIIRNDDTIFIKAYNDRGVLYGVYEFLHRAFGYECYAADEIVIEKKSVAYLPDINLTDAPSFEGRFLDGPLDYNQELQSKMRMKNISLTSAKYGGSAMTEWMNMHCESFLSIVNREDYQKYYRENYPELDPSEYRYEWFSNPTTSGLQWCLTNQTLMDVAVEKLKEMILAHPDAIYVNIAEEDLGTFCNCDRESESYCGMSCKQSRQKYGMGGTLVRFVNEIVEKLEAWRLETCPERDLKYVTFVYHETINAPVKTVNNEYVPIDETVIPHEKLYVRFAPITRCYNHDLCDTTCSVNKPFGENFVKWCAITDHLTVWEYRTNYNYYFLFFNNYSTLQDEYIRYYEKGCVNMMAEYMTSGTLGSMSDLNVYLNSKLQWNVYADQNKIINDFMENFYKDAAPYMNEYLNLMRTYLASVEQDYKDKGKEFHWDMYAAYSPDIVTYKTWNVAVLEKAQELLDKASAVYDKIEDAELRETMKTRILRESVCLRFIILYNYEFYYNIYSLDYTKAIDEWENDLKTLNVVRYAEVGMVAAFIDSLRTKGLS